LISGTLACTASAGSPYSVTVAATDPSPNPDLFDSETFSWSVTNLNCSPQVTNPGDQTDDENQPVSLQIQASDPDGDGLSYSATGLPEGLSIDATNGLISGTLSFNASIGSPHPVQVIASDNGAPLKNGIVDFNWTVNDVNAPPQLTNPGDQTDTEGDLVSLHIQASDPDNGDTLLFDADGLPAGLTIDPISGEISGTIDELASIDSPYTVTVLAIDDGSPPLSTQISFTWTVVDSNQPPRVTNPGDQSNYEGVEIVLKAKATDPEGDIITFSADGLPPGLSVNSVTGLISGTIDLDASSGSPYTVTVTATDDAPPTHSKSVEFEWTVLDRPTVFVPLALR
jgi:hypothetical protein